MPRTRMGLERRRLNQDRAMMLSPRALTTLPALTGELLHRGQQRFGQRGFDSARSKSTGQQRQSLVHNADEK